MIVAIIVVLAVGLLAFLMRGKSEDSVASPDASPGEPTSALDDEPDDDEDDGAPRELVAVTSDGWAFVPDGHGIQFFPVAEPNEELRAEADPVRAEREGKPGAWEELYNPPSRRNFRDAKPGEHMGPGDLIAARVKRGAPGVDPWRLEALGRDREYRHWPFETQDAANAALDLVRSRVVPAPDAEPDPDEMPIGDADFVLARAEAEAIEAELASGDEPEPTR